MSEVGTPAENPSSVVQDGTLVETVIIPEPVVAEEPAVEAEAPTTEEVAEEPAKPKQKPWFQSRIDELTRQKNEEKRANEALKARLDVIEAANKQDDEAPKPVFTQTAFDQAVEEAANRKFAQETTKSKTNAWVEAGNKEFGKDSFIEKCNMVASIGAGDSPEFMQIITDPDIIPDGHKVVALLAEQPEEAQRILALEPMKMAAALTRFATTAKAPDKPVSQAPKPITPLGGSAKSAAPSDNDSDAEWLAKRNAVAWDRQPRKA